MLVSGSDLGFVAAAVQSWSLPHLQQHHKNASTAANRYVGVSIAILLLVAAFSCLQELVLHGYLLGKIISLWLAVEAAYFALGYTR